jgi:hypothetical protein
MQRETPYWLLSTLRYIELSYSIYGQYHLIPIVFLHTGVYLLVLVLGVCIRGYLPFAAVPD